MRYYPVNLDLNNRCCLVVGGGSVGARKIETLVKCGAKVTVVSPKVKSVIIKMSDQNLIRLKCRRYERSDLAGCFLVIGATNDELLNRRISNDAAKHNLLCNIVDRPEICNFILPAIIHRGNFLLTISTSGKSPAFAKQLREELEIKFGPEYALLLDLMGAIRVKLLNGDHDFERHKILFEKLLKNDLLNLIKDDNIPEIDLVLASVLGPGYNYKKLMK